MRVLVVEDDTTMANYIEAILTRTGVMARSVSSQSEAAKELSTMQYDGVMTDLVLEDGSGLEVARICAAIGTPIVFVTGTGDEHNMNLMHQYGFVVQKPIRMNAVMRIVDFFRRHRPTKGG